MNDVKKKEVLIEIGEYQELIPLRYARLMGYVVSSLECDGQQIAISPEHVTHEAWKVMCPLLKVLYQHQESPDEKSLKEVDEALAVLKIGLLLEVLKAADYLMLPGFMAQALEAASSHNDLSFDRISELSVEMRNMVIKHRAIALLGPVPGKPYHCYQEENPEFRPSIVSVQENTIFSRSSKLLHLFTTHEKTLRKLAGDDLNQISQACMGKEGSLIIGTYHGRIRVLKNNGDGSLEWDVPFPRDISFLEGTPDNKIISSSSGDRLFRVWDDKGKLLFVCEHPAPVSLVTLLRDGTIASADLKHTLRIWEPDGTLRAACFGHNERIRGIGTTPDLKIVSMASDGVMCLWSGKGELLKTYDCKTHLYAMCVTLEGTIALAGADKRVHLLHDDGVYKATCLGHNDCVLALAHFNRDYLLSGSLDNTVAVWNAHGKRLAICSGHTRPVVKVAVAADGTIISESWDRTIMLWDISLLFKLDTLDDEQAFEIWNLLESYDAGDPASCWKQIRTVVLNQETLFELMRKKFYGALSYVWRGLP